VAAQAVGLQLEEPRLAARADRAHRLRSSGVHRLDVIAVQDLHRQTVAARPLGDGILAHGVEPVHKGLPLVVLADEEERQLPLHGEVE